MPTSTNRAIGAICLFLGGLVAIFALIGVAGLSQFHQMVLVLAAASLLLAGWYTLPNEYRKRSVAVVVAFGAVVATLSGLLQATQTPSDRQQDRIETVEDTSNEAPPLHEGELTNSDEEATRDVYEFLKVNRGREVRLNLLVDLASDPSRPNTSSAEELLQSPRDQQRVVTLQMSDNVLLMLQIAPGETTQGDYLSPVANEFIRVEGNFRVVAVDPDVGTTQIYRVELRHLGG